MPSVRTAVASSAYREPALTITNANIASSITCQDPANKGAKGIVLLVTGTAEPAKSFWVGGPYWQLLPAQGFSPCYVTLPTDSLGDVQLTAEYVVGAIKYLAPKSKTRKVAIVAHSQGAGLNTPWALDFYPSTVPLVSMFFAMAPDLRGTLDGNLGCFADEAFTKTCAASFWQQAQGSNLLKALNINAGSQIVPTTAIATLEDEIVTPQTPPLPASFIPGATNILIQSPDACGPLHVVDHLTIANDAAVYNLALDALTHGGHADTSRLNKATCLGFGNVGFDVSSHVANVKQIFQTLIEAGFAVTGTDPGVSYKSEPLLRKFVCQRYPTHGFSCGST
ncbi:uncharacterized protein L969DRAFT_45754 [Mixia osmundae IAM 14324]|nr:uncharacterized protein L969DRAFT_45754 [Mixia osmundae IAM 14324]KEI41569.1 hypothetical protein L969DRAFT_45754 [Mixia osmundae IAM 14324]